MTPEERDATLVFIRESLAKEPDAPPLRSLRFLLSELDRVTAERDEWADVDLVEFRRKYGYIATNIQLQELMQERDKRIRHLESELDRVTAERDEWARRRLQSIYETCMAGPGGCHADVIESSLQHAVMERDAALADVKRLREALENIFETHQQVRECSQCVGAREALAATEVKT